MKLTQRSYKAAFLSMVLASLAACRHSDDWPSAYYFPRLRVDSTLHAWPEGSRTILKPAFPDNLYTMFHTATGLDIINHLKVGPGTLQQQLLYLEARRGESLYRVEKSDQIAKGSYGVLSVTRKCFYRPNYRNSVSVGVWFSTPNGEPERPVELAAAPDPLPEISSVSLVKIYQRVPTDLASSIAQHFGVSQLPPAQKPDGFVVVADYESDGTLSGAAFSTSRSGNWAGGSGSGRESPSSLGEFDMPQRFDVQKYTRSGKLPKVTPGLVPARTLVLVLYDFGKLIRQDELRGNVAVSSLWLQPGITEEQNILDPPCNAQLRKQQSERQSTTW